MDHHDNNDIDRRHALKCMVWAGSGLVWTLNGGVPNSHLIGSANAATASFSFVQISDSHIGFNKAANPNPNATLTEAIAKIDNLPSKPAFMIHTGDITHLSKPQEFDDADQLIGGAKLDVHYVPGEHDVIDEKNGEAYLARYGKLSKGKGWYSFDHAGVHFVGLVNVYDLKAGGMGNLGAEQLAWLAADLKARSASTPLVIFAHIPLWTVAADWGWGTQDGTEALKLLTRFGSVTALNGHIHQIMQKVEGNVTFHTARSTAFPQPAPGTAPSPGPKLVPPEQLRSVLGVSSVTLARGNKSLAIIDSTLAE
ncbi:metallophosphoesterase [Beijerinckiaceae bacterium]|nr:metallophosphoesterase [Beijerinckiaceae bacterium]